jgi:hypothetical protein
MITGCYHGDDPEMPRPCPPMCPSQFWPRYMFRLDWRGKHWVPRRRYREPVRQLLVEWHERRAEIAAG